jgi:hypothetical protein
MPVLKLHDAVVTIDYVKETVTRGGLRRFEIGAENVVGQSLGERLIGLTTLDQWKASLCQQAKEKGLRLHIKYRETIYFDAALLFVELVMDAEETA